VVAALSSFARLGLAGLFFGMATQHDLGVAENEGFLEGKLLIALPGMPDDRFQQTVIYMCAHSASGAMGIVINKPMPGLSFADLMDQLEIATKSRRGDFPILFGGPVEKRRGFVLHSNDYESTDATLSVSDQISLTATVDILRALAEGRGPKQVILALGYAGWGPGQIETELQDNGWLHCDASPSLIFDAKPETKWRAALQCLGIDSTGLSANTGHA
jgi:putative transcriptional regulator